MISKQTAQNLIKERLKLGGVDCMVGINSMERTKEGVVWVKGVITIMPSYVSTEFNIPIAAVELEKDQDV